MLHPEDEWTKFFVEHYKTVHTMRILALVGDGGRMAGNVDIFNNNEQNPHPRYTFLISVSLMGTEFHFKIFDYM